MKAQLNVERDTSLEPGTSVRFYVKQEQRDRSIKREQKAGKIRSVSYPLARIEDAQGVAWTVHLDDVENA